MGLEICSRVLWTQFSLDNPLGYVCLSLCEGQYDYLFGLHYWANTHGDGILGDIFNPVEWWWRIWSSFTIEGDQPSFGFDWWSWLIETYVAGASHSQELEIDTTRLVDFFFITLAECIYIVFGDGSIWDVDILRVDINVIEKHLMHEAPVRMEWLLTNKPFWITF